MNLKNLYQIREMSVLSFNERVLQEAEDARNPLMERLKFLGIFSSNMDEFFKVRAASIQRRIELRGKRGLHALLERVGRKSKELDERFRAAYDDITAAMARRGVRILTDEDVERSFPDLRPWLDEYFEEKVLPSLVPLILQDSLPFPPITDGDLYFGVIMDGTKHPYAILRIPSELPRFVELPNGMVMYLDDVIRHSLRLIFSIFSFERIHAYEFKISRDAQLDIDDDFSEGHVRKMERVLKQRKGGRPTRLVYDEAMPASLLSLLRRELRITADDTLIPGSRYHNMKDLMRLPSRDHALRFEEMEPAKHPVLDVIEKPMLEILAERDVLVTYPYQSFSHVLRLLREAAIDPEVEAISMTLYRSASFSQVVNALISAARNGKSVFVSIELQARFDEEHNIAIAKKLTEVGATVGYGVPPMKVHSKLLFIRRGRQCFAGLSTGNFNEVTGGLYVDSILFTTHRKITAEVERVLDYLKNAAQMRVVERPAFKHLMVSPFSARKMLQKLIDREREKGRDGYLFLKVNHLTDGKLVKAIRAAADAGVQMDLVVRTTYGLRRHPNIRAISILDRYLEHQRIYIFGKGGDRVVYMSSADLMERNLDWRVEVGFPVRDPELQQEVVDMMALQVGDTYKARVLDDKQSNRYMARQNARKRAQYATHAYLARKFEAAVDGGRAPRRRELPTRDAVALPALARRATGIVEGTAGGNGEESASAAASGAELSA